MAALRAVHPRRGEGWAAASQATEAGKGKADEMNNQLSGFGGKASAAYPVIVRGAGSLIAFSADYQDLPPRVVELSSEASRTSDHEREEDCSLPSDQAP